VTTVDDERIRRYAALPVPRYTSYPTAAEFDGTVGPEHHARWLRRLDADAGVSVYLHVPYCRDLCLYCGCHAKAVRQPDVIEAYRIALEAEIAMAAATMPDRPRLVRLHWGGGTPSILGPDGLASVMQVLADHFALSPGYEHAIELDPRNVTRPLTRQLAALGVNRASLGVQDIDPAVQVAIGRVQPMGVIEAAASHLRAAGIDRINLDLIYGLPLQTTASLVRTCDALSVLGASRIACFGYAHLPARRANQRLIDATLLPDADARFEQAAMVASCLAGQGYTPVGMDHFALPGDALAVAAREGRLRRNFQGYTDDDTPTLLGFGASAISRFCDGYVQNITDNPAYCRTVGLGHPASVRGRALTDSDRRRARIIEELVCNFRVDLNRADLAGDFADEMALLRPLVADGLLEVKGRVIAMTAAGRPLVRVAAAIFDEFRRESCVGFSPAV
jgi:oxygen-independent coproporphyrinogen-3 oxidase